MLGLILIVLLSITRVLGGQVLQAHDKSFKALVQNSDKYSFVDFYADWCRHCGKLSPVLDTVADTFENESMIQIVKVNGDKDGRRLSKKYVVQGYPTMLLFHGDDDPVEYNGGRDATSISNFIQQMSHIRLQNTDDYEDAVSGLIQVTDDNIQEKVLDASYKTLVVFTSAHCKSCPRVRADFEILAQWYANDLEFIRFAEVNVDGTATRIQEQFAVKVPPLVLLFDPAYIDANGLKNSRVYSGRLEKSSLNKFVSEMSGIRRDGEGKLTADAGVIPELREKIGAFLSLADKSSGIALLKELRGLSKRQDVMEYRMLPYYVHLANLAVGGVRDNFETEKERLAKIATSSEGIQMMLNVLSEFST